MVKCAETPAREYKPDAERQSWKLGHFSKTCSGGGEIKSGGAVAGRDKRESPDAHEGTSMPFICLKGTLEGTLSPFIYSLCFIYHKGIFQVHRCSRGRSLLKLICVREL